jgi:hypothetical protein
MDLDCEVIFNRQISDRMIRKVPELKALANGDGQLVFPVLISGKPPALITIPNISSIASKLTTGNIGTVIKEVIKDPKKLRGSIGKILGF